MKVLVCGGRKFLDYALLEHTLNKLPITTIIHGGAPGADSLAGKFAHAHNITLIVYHANWKKHGKAAGPIRNMQMLSESKPDLVVAFPGGRGTTHTVKIARDAGTKVLEVGSP